MARGTLAAVAPMEVPTIRRVRGSTKKIKIMKGMLRKRFTSQPNTALKVGAAMMPPGLVVVSSTPRGRPMT